MSAHDRRGRRFFLYFLSGASGELLYIGRSSNPVHRIRAHMYEASNPDTMEATRKALWLMDVTRVDMAGPYFWGEADLRERALIRLAQPYGNFTHNPLVRLLGRNSKRVNAA